LEVWNKVVSISSQFYFVTVNLVVQNGTPIEIVYQIMLSDSMRNLVVSYEVFERKYNSLSKTDDMSYGLLFII
jgi:hypothetical protein